MRFAALLNVHKNYDAKYVSVEVAVPAGEAGSQFVDHVFDQVEAAVRESQAYRGKVLSLEDDEGFSGAGGGIRVHRLPPVGRADLVLPETTLRLLEANVFEFARRRADLRARGMSGKKGLLFYGPPGTGKTHTIRYLAQGLPDHTTFLVASEQLGQIDRYFALARLLQPALLVLEDVDLIARDRDRDADSGCDQVHLNRLLNEMDGLRDDADIFVVLTTNRPHEIETALSQRPGRVDQAIEFPLPDEAGRRHLVALYGGAASLAPGAVDDAVARTAGVSAAFIKELMRRAAQVALADGPEARIEAAHVRAAMDEMLLGGGRLNARLLGGATEAA